MESIAPLWVDRYKSVVLVTTPGREVTLRHVVEQARGTIMTCMTSLKSLPSAPGKHLLLKPDLCFSGKQYFCEPLLDPNPLPQVLLQF